MRTQIQSFLKRAFSPKTVSIAAQMSYYWTLAFIPAMIFLISFTSKLYLPVDSLLSYLQAAMPASAYNIVFSAINEVLSSQISFGTLALALWFLVSGMHAFVLGLATSYPDTNHRRPLKVMTLSFVFAFIFIAIIIVSILLIVFGQHLTALLARFLPVGTNVLITGKIIGYLVIFFMMVLSFSLLYQFAPNIKLHLKDVFWGALFSAIGWIIATFFFRFYVENFGRYGLIFGSLGGIFVFLLWLYLLIFIMLVGNEINVSYYLHKYKPDQWADS